MQPTYPFSFSPVLLALLNALPDNCLILLPDAPSFTIVAANESFATTNGLSVDQLLGRALAEAFPANVDEPEPTGIRHFSDSLRKVIQTKAPDAMATHRYDVRTHSNQEYEKRYWSSINTPVLDENGDLIYLMHTTKDVTEQMETRLQVSDSEARLHEVIELAELGTWRYNLLTGRAFYSDRLTQWFGFPTNEMDPRSASKAIAPDDLARVSVALQQALDPQIGRFRLEHGVTSLKTGQQRSIRVWGRTYFDEQQKPYLLIGTAQDITHERLAQEQLRHQVAQHTSDLQVALANLQRSNQTIQQMLDGSMAAITLMDAVRSEPSDPASPIIDFVWRGANRAAEQLMGRTRPDIISQQLLTLLSKGRMFFQDFVNVVETGQPLRNEYYYQPINLWLDVSVVKNGDGIILSCLDITERKEAEQRASDNATNLQAVLNSSPAAIAFLKAVRNEQSDVIDFGLTVCNQKFGQFIGKPLSGLKDQLASELALQLWQQNTLIYLRQVLKTGQPTYLEQPNPRNESGSWVGISITREDDGIVISVLDITALKQAEQQQQHWLHELANSHKTLQGLEQVHEQVRQRGEFLRSTTHDLRSSFGAIQGAAWMLNMINTEEERANILSMLQRNIRQMTTMLTQLLDYSRLEAGQEQVQISRFDAARLLQELCEGLQPLASERKLWLKTGGPDPFYVEGDSVKVQRIVQNLILNALKYAQTGGTTVRWGDSVKPGCWQLTVRDTGPGFSATLMNWLNDSVPDASTEPDILSSGDFSMGGEGIGLTIVKRLCALLSGTLLVESHPGAGTCFTLSLPGAINA